MRRMLRDFRLIPVVLFATISLFALKTIGLIVDGHYTLDSYLDDDITGTIPGTTVHGPLPSPVPSGKTRFSGSRSKGLGSPRPCRIPHWYPR